MTNEMFADIKKLCICCGESIDLIAKKHYINQDNVAKLFMNVMNEILKEIDHENQNN